MRPAELAVLREAAEREGWTLRPGRGNPDVMVAERGDERKFAPDEESLLSTLGRES